MTMACVSGSVVVFFNNPVNELLREMEIIRFVISSMNDDDDCRGVMSASRVCEQWNWLARDW